MISNAFIEETIKEWKNEAKIKYPVLFNRDVAKENILFIYTNRPGLLIGVHGTLHDKYFNIIKERYSDFKKIVFIDSILV